jgi:hypothetical protein
MMAMSANKTLYVSNIEDWVEYYSGKKEKESVSTNAQLCNIDGAVPRDNSVNRLKSTPRDIDDRPRDIPVLEEDKTHEAKIEINTDVMSGDIQLVSPVQTAVNQAAMAIKRRRRSQKKSKRKTPGKRKSRVDKGRKRRGRKKVKKKKKRKKQVRDIFNY